MAVGLVAVKAGILPLPVAAKPIAGFEFVQVQTVVVTGVSKTKALVVTASQNSLLDKGSTLGVGLTVMKNIFVAPEHETPPFVKVGVTVTVAVFGALPALITANAGISPEPPAANPILGSLLVQL